jgi:hypothetical protein
LARVIKTSVRAFREVSGCRICTNTNLRAHPEDYRPRHFYLIASCSKHNLVPRNEIYHTFIDVPNGFFFTGKKNETKSDFWAKKRGFLLTLFFNRVKITLTFEKEGLPDNRKKR